MPTFDTPEPISVTLELVFGNARIIATERADTVVDVRPTDESREPDVRAAEQTRVEFAGGRLLVQTPRQSGRSLFGKPGSIDVTIELPVDSRLETAASMAVRLITGSLVRFVGTGRLGECRIASAGDIELEQVGAADLTSGIGTVAVDHVAGDARVSTGSGKLRLGRIDGNAEIKNSNGDCWLGEVAGNLRVTTANGQIHVEAAGADVTANTANGGIRVGGLTRGTASLKTALGTVEIGIRPGTAARLDLQTHFGNVLNHMDAASSPEPSEQTVEVRARTSYGDIVVHRTDSPDPVPNEGVPHRL